MQVGSLEFLDRASQLRAAHKAKFYDIPSYLKLWTQPYGGISGKRVLDFGCGGGESAAGIAMGHDPAYVLGVDINDESSACADLVRSTFGQPLPPNLRFQEVRPGEVGNEGNWDIVYSWSVFEHVALAVFDDVISAIREKMVPGGLFFVQIAPLFFSSEGSHLWSLGYTHWQHLTKMLSDIEADLSLSPLSSSEKADLWSMFMTLNRISAPVLLDRFTRAGFTLVRQQLDQEDKQIPEDIVNVYTREALITNQIVALFQKKD